jgi:hypothetical protein
MGMFFLTKHDIKATDIFPKDLSTKICADFTCKGGECTRENCPYSHPRNACKLTAETIAAIVRHFSLKKIRWLNKWHFIKLGHLPADVKALVGEKMVHPPVRGSDHCNTLSSCLHLVVCFSPLINYCPDTITDIHLALLGLAPPSPPQVV